ncbi:SRPBCC family protein [Frankia sp. AgB1.9]|uniref:SRPBCC family protein n=1 Tax=unclassified Frankia TaxID=2632575 RepID=UPI001931FF3D|nr:MULTISPECIES: SRPBCC family protein [unclassified Frankia]MBL7486904.1 SRPBCC family protein [Frankia sp. AgW1.1]MBL7547209.1 SRPBCC family protein [Frankia sp. AgB1.9]MBL7623999.1 SRPBCC family protein [Frankia sp. AgB1.8]
MADAVVTTVSVGKRKVARQAVVSAPAVLIFDLVADPRRHPELDGSGTVRDSRVSGPDRLSEGARFSVGMKQFGFPYRITSTVTEFDEGRVIEWRHPLGHRWRWELEEVGAGATRVTETFDYTRARGARSLELFGYPARNGDGISATLSALANRFSPA